MAGDQPPWQFWIDVGGTFTDCVAQAPDGLLHTHKLLSTGVYKGRVAEGSTADVLVIDSPVFPRRFLLGCQVRLKGGETARVRAYDPAQSQLTLVTPLDYAPVVGTPFELASGEPAPIVAIRYILDAPLDKPLGRIEVRLGTTRGTNALLERQGARTALVMTEGFGDALEIAAQNRPRLFELDIRKPRPLYEVVVEAKERLSATGETLKPLDRVDLAARLTELRRQGIQAVAICFVNSYVDGRHEDEAYAVAAALGFPQISVSSRVTPLQRLVPRGDTTLVDAYLTPVIKSYVAEVRSYLPEATLRLMTSAGGLVDAAAFVGKDSILSGPAGGVVGVARVAREANLTHVIGFDMGGTSTDVSRFDGTLERRYEMELTDAGRETGVRIVAPMIAIETVAAGGGSICAFDGIRLTVGPASAGADPGPACYGRGGPLTITDCNMLLGRISPQRFSFPLDIPAARRRLSEVLAQVGSSSGKVWTADELAAGFIALAASNMAQPIKKISLAKGYDVRDYTLVSFGGAGAQHACAIAEELGINRIIQHPYASLLSAYGMGMAALCRHAARDIGRAYAGEIKAQLTETFAHLEAELLGELARETLPSQATVRATRSLDLRYQGQDSTLTLAEPADGDWAQAFEDAHRRTYGFAFTGRPLEVRVARVELAAAREPPLAPCVPAPPHAAQPVDLARAWFGGHFSETAVYDRAALAAGAALSGPAIIAGEATSVVVEPGWRARVTPRGHLELERISERTAPPTGLSSTPDPLSLALFNNQFASIAEQMGAVLQRTSLSVNVKERLDFSCAIFAPDGGLIVNAPHIPVHLGAMGESVRAVLREAGATMAPGDVFVTNDPYRGGSHLPDVTVITPVFAADSRRLLFLTGSRAHHAEIGGITPGSMPPLSTNLAEEGVLIRCFRLVHGERASEDELRQLLATAPYPSRAIDDNIADINAQIAANETGRHLLLALIAHLGSAVVEAYMGHVRTAATSRMCQALSRLTEGRRTFKDAMDDGTPVVVTATVRHGPPPEIELDFTGTGGVSSGNLNANTAIVKAASLYVLRCLIDAEIPLNEGVLAPVRFVIPGPSLLRPNGGHDPTRLPAVTAGNVETSQRLVDVLLGALGLAAASQGTMNNLLFGRAAAVGRPGFGYYETIAGGAGAGPGFAGASAVQTHMTNTRITDVEVLEERFPVRLRRFAIRRGSGGEGTWRGGDGIIRELEFLEPLAVSLISSRRLTAPYGLAGGGPGRSGRNALRRAATGETEELPPMVQLQVAAGDVLIIETPGGGGYGNL